MADLRAFSSVSNIVRFCIKDATTGQGKTGLSTATSGLVVSTIADNEASATAYSGANLQTITTLGTFAAPTSGKCRIGEVDSSNHKGLYEFQFADARFSVTSSKRLVISVNDGESTILDTDYEIELVQFNPFDAVRLGLTALPNVASGSAGAIITSGTGTAQLSVSGGVAQADVAKVLGTTSVGAAGYVGIDWAHVLNPSSSVGLSGTSINVVATVTNGVNVSQINSVSTSSVTVVAANLGTTQPVNFTGTGSSALVKDQVGGYASGQDPATLVLDVAQSGHNTSGTIGADIGAAGSAGDPWATALPGSYASGTAGNILGNAPAAPANFSLLAIDGSGVVEADVASINSVSTSGVTTVSANLGTAQPVNFTGAGTSALVKSTSSVPTTAILTGTAQAGSTSSTIVLSTAASATNNLYVGDTVAVDGSTGAGQARTIVSYDGTTKVAAVSAAWVTTPDNTSTFSVYAVTAPSLFSDQGVAVSGTSSTITLATTASAVSGIYVGSIVTILSGTDAGDTSEITAYNGSTKVATVSPNWVVTPDSTSAYAVIPTVSGSGSTSTPTTDVNVISVNGSTFAGVNVPSILADGVDHGGTPGSSTARIACAKLHAKNLTGDAIVAEGFGGSSRGMVLYGDHRGLEVDSPGAGAVLFSGDNGYALNLSSTGAPSLYITPTDAVAIMVQPFLFTGSAAGGVTILSVGDVPVIQLGDGVNGAQALLALAGTGGGANMDAVKGVGQGTGAGFVSTPDAVGFGGAVIRANTAQAGSSTTITLDAGASATNGLYIGELIVLTSGTGAGQTRIITNYNGTTKVATIDANWAEAPDSTSTFSILPADSTPFTPADVAAAVWTDITGAGDFGAPGSIGDLLVNQGVTVGGYIFGQDPASLVLSTVAADFTAAGTVGGLLNTTLNVPISTRSTYAGGPVASVTGDVAGKVLGGGAGTIIGVGAAIDAPANFASLAIDTSGRVKVQGAVVRNQALANFAFVMTDSTSHVPTPGFTVTATRRIDSGSFAACANAAAGVANGWYTINLAASDLNGAVVDFRFTAPGADDRDITVITTP